jgi:hypothetical protein
MLADMVALLALAVLAASPEAGDGWKQVVDGDVKVFSRAKAGQRVMEMRAEMTMAATPAEVRAVLLDEDYARRTPYVAETRLVAQPAPLVKIKYTRLAFPVIEDRDYFIEVTREQDLAPDGSGIYHATWKPWGLDRPPRDGVVRVTTNEGYWDVRPEPDWHGCHVTYYLLSDPGGNIPAFAINLGNKRVLPDVLHAIYDEVVKRRGSGGR